MNFEIEIIIDNALANIMNKLDWDEDFPDTLSAD